MPTCAKRRIKMTHNHVKQTIKRETVLSHMLCRICAREQPDNCLNNLLTSIHDCHNGHRLYFVDMLQDCLQRSIAKDDGYPLNICLDCTSNLIVAYNFRLLCDGSEKKFEEMLTYHSDSDEFEQKMEVTVEELVPESDVKLPSGFMNCAAIDVLNTNCADIENKRDNSETEQIKPQRKPKIKKQYECYRCKKEFKRIDRLRRHMATYEKSANKSWSCSDCHKRFTQRNKLVEHFYKHVSTSCEYCSEAFTTLRDLRKHYEQAHSNQITLHPCDQCKKKFVLKAQLRIHKHNHMDNHMNIHMDKHNKQYDCNLCNETFVSEAQLKGHIRNLHTQCLCSECGKTFKNNSLLASHQKVHKSEKPFVCSKCPSRFKWRVALTYHKTIHEQEKKHVCETCGMSFTTRTAMRGHAKIHSGERPYACDKCSKRFLRRTHLKRHNLSHTGEKPHICKYCGKGFRQSAQLNKHIRLHVGENTYQCKLCPKNFKFKAEMKKHEYEHYENQDFAVGTIVSQKAIAE